MTSTDSGKRYRTECTGRALETVQAHSAADAALTFFGACFCPFVQRVWIALELLGEPYQVRDVHLLFHDAYTDSHA